MVPYKQEDLFSQLPLGVTKLSGSVGKQMDTFLRERVLSDFALHTIYPETEEPFRLRQDDETAIGRWRGEFWGKWIISACRVQRYTGNERLKDFIHTACLHLIATADADGYIGTYRSPENCIAPTREMVDAVQPGASLWNWNIWCRKYTLWGLLEGYELTQDEGILAAAAKSADQLMGMLSHLHLRLKDTGTFFGLPSCSIMKPMLILYRHTGEKKYLDFALQIADEWENPNGECPNLIANAGCGKGLHEWYPGKNWAKAYEMMSCLDGLMELYRVTGVKKYLRAVENIQELLVKHEGNAVYSVGFNDLFIHGGPLANSCSEPCDVIHWMRVNSDLFRLTGKLKYLDAFEKAFYNPFLAASFSDGKWGARAVRTAGRHQVATGQSFMQYSHCCVNNMPRGYMNAVQSFVMEKDGAYYVNLYTDFSCDLNGLKISASGTYLQDGKAVISVQTSRPVKIMLRIPAWSRTAEIDGVNMTCPGTYVEKTVTGNARIALAFDFTPRLTETQPREPLPPEDARFRRFLDGNNIPASHMVWDARAKLEVGPLLLTRSKKNGNTEEEMFSSDSVAGRGCRATLRSVPSDTVRAAFEAKFTAPGFERTLRLCDYATGSNEWSPEDDKLFNIYL